MGRRSTRGAVFAVVAAGQLLTAGRAEASRGRTHPPAGIGRPHANSVAVVQERIRVQCKTRTCSYIATWRLRVDAPDRVSWEVHGGGVAAVRVDGRLVEPAVDPLPGRNHEREAAWGRGFARYSVELPRAGEVTVDVTGSVVVFGSSGGFFYPILWTRHPLLTPAHEEARIWFGSPGPPPQQQEIVVDYTGRWRVRRRADWSVEHWDRSHTRATLKRPRGRTELRLVHGPPLPGGPLLALGSSWTPRPRFRMRAGYELGSARFLVHSVVVETDFRRRVLLVPATEAATGSLGLLPSFGLGAGAPVQVYPNVRVGGRAQASISWPVFSVVGTFDAFGATRSRRREFHGGLFFQFSV